MANNKNKKRIGVAAAALAMVVGVGATAGTTLAKYISSVEVKSYTATVAKWGYTITADVDELFGEKYGDVDEQFAKVSGDDTVVVSATAYHNVVAPGTKGEMTLTINGTAEVNAILIINITDFVDVVLADETTELYRPLVWKVNPSKEAEEDDDDDDDDDDDEDEDEEEEEGEQSLAEILAFAINEAIFDEIDNTITYSGDDEKEVMAGVYSEDASSVYVFLPANTTIDNFKLNISWEWPFETEKVSEEASVSETTATKQYRDEEDTLLGYISNGTEYDELSDNIKAWLLDNCEGEEKGSYTKAVTEYNEAVEKYNKAVARYEKTKSNGEESDGQEELEQAVQKHQTAVQKYESKLAKLEKAAKKWYEKLADESIVEVKLGFSATIVQTQFADWEALEESWGKQD